MNANRRILVIGSPGSGKSTFSRELSEIRCIPIYHLDKIFWKNGWNPIPEEEFKDKLIKILQTNEWIMDGNYSQNLAMRMKYAQTVIFLDIPWILCTLRVIKRNIHNRHNTRKDITEGCEEKFDHDFYELLKFIRHFPKTDRVKIIKLLEVNAYEKEIIIFSNSKSVKQYLQKIKNEEETSKIVKVA